MRITPSPLFCSPSNLRLSDFNSVPRCRKLLLSPWPRDGRFRGGSITYIFDHRRFLYCSTYRCSITGWLLVSLHRFVLHPVKRRDWTSGRRRNIEGVIVASISIVCPSASTRSFTRLASDFGNIHIASVVQPSVHLQRRAVIANAEANGKLRELATYAGIPRAVPDLP